MHKKMKTFTKMCIKFESLHVFGLVLQSMPSPPKFLRRHVERLLRDIYVIKKEIVVMQMSIILSISKCAILCFARPSHLQSVEMRSSGL
jgi:hypothetical protein